MSTLAENAAAVKAAQEAIDAAIVDKGGTTEGGLANAAAAIAAIPSGGGEPAYPHPWVMSDDDPTKLSDDTHLWYYFINGGAAAFAYFGAQFRVSEERYADPTKRFFTVDWGDGTVEEIAATATLASKTLTHRYEDAGEHHVVIRDYGEVYNAIFASRTTLTKDLLSSMAIRQAQIGLNSDRIVSSMNGLAIRYIAFQNRLKGASDSTLVNLPLLREIDISAFTSLGNSVLYGCSSLASIGDLPVCTSIGINAFFDCTSLASIGNLPVCTSIGNAAFQNCSSLASIGDLPVCTSIGNAAFVNCTSLASIGDLPVCTSIGTYAFQNCSSLASIGDLPVCTSIGERAFYQCKSLVSVGDLTACDSIGYVTFGNCSSLASIGDLSSCTSIGTYAFQYCSSLASIGDLPVCTSIGNAAFVNCTSLASIGDLSSCASIGVNAFQNCNALSLVDFGTQTSTQVMAITGFTYIPERQTCVIRCADGDFYRSGSTLVPLA